MATYAQRAQALGDLLVNGTATAQQIDRLGVGIARATGQQDHYASLTNAGKAQWLVSYVRAHLLGLVHSGDQVAAMASLPNVNTDFQEAP